MKSEESFGHRVYLASDVRCAGIDLEVFIYSYEVCATTCE